MVQHWVWFLAPGEVGREQKLEDYLHMHASLKGAGIMMWCICLRIIWCIYMCV